MENKFLPDGRQFLWSAHSIDLAETCHRRYYYEAVLNLATRDQNIHAFFGITIHTAVERYERLRSDGADHTRALREVVTATLRETWRDGAPMLQHDDLKLLPGSAHLKTRENLIRTIIWYFEEYGDNDPCRTAVLHDDTPAVELPFTFQLDDEIMIRGRMDRIIRFGGEPYVHDSKTTGTAISRYYFRRFDLDTEMSMFSLAAGVVFQSPVKGVLVDAMQIAVGFTRFERSLTYRTTEQLAEFTDNIKYHIHRAWEAPKHGYPMRLSACQKFGGCPFTSVCARDPRVRAEYLETGYTQREEH